MFKLSQRNNQSWGLSAYEVPASHFDHIKHKQASESLEYATGKQRRQRGKLDPSTERNPLDKVLAKRMQAMPEPWRYETALPWVKGRKSGPEGLIPSKNMQAIKAKWQDKENPEIVYPQKAERKKLDMTTRKNTYIDQVQHQNTKPNYPKPGPADCFYDEKCIKKFYDDKAELFARKSAEEPRKSTLPSAN